MNAEDLTQPTPPSRAGVAGDDRSPIHVLCVDDNALIVATLKNVIENTHDMEWGGSLSRADDLVHHCRTHFPDIVLIDLAMPGAEVFGTIEKMRDACPDSRVIVFTAHDIRLHERKAFDAGAWGFVSKLEPTVKLLEIIRAVANGEMHVSRK